ncbi:MAG TPA: photosystem II protein Psb27 [Chroococcidiopsis sp.]
MKTLLSRMFALLLVMVVGLMGCTSTPSGLSGNYREDVLSVVTGLRTAITLPNDSPDKMAAQAQARELINDFSSLYRRNTSVTKLSSFTTMRTALNSLAGHYSSYPNRPVPEKLKKRLEQEFAQIESALKRGS